VKDEKKTAGASGIGGGCGCGCGSDEVNRELL